MQHYIAKILYQIQINQNTHQYEDKCIYIQAHNAYNAYALASEMAVQHIGEFINSNQQKVYWHLLGITYLQPIIALQNGVELFSEIKEITQFERNKYLEDQILKLRNEHCIPQNR